MNCRQLGLQLKATSASIWPIFELTYKLFEREAVDFLKVHRL